MGAEESKSAFLNNENDHKPYSIYENKSVTPPPKVYSAREIENEAKIDAYAGYRTGNDTREKSRRKPIVDEKENRHRRRRHRSTDDHLSDRRRETDSSSHRKRVTSDDRDRSKSKESKAAKNRKSASKSPREPKGSDNNKKKEVKEKQNTLNKDRKKNKTKQESKGVTLERKQKSGDKQNKSSFCLPNVSEVRRRKKKSELEKHKRAHRSVPDLSSDDTSRVGAWLNSNQFMWPPEHQVLPQPYMFPYGSLPRMHPYSSLQQDMMPDPRPIVDGMGSPVGVLYSNGAFVPDTMGDASSLETDSNPKYSTSFRYSMPAFVHPPYPYFAPPHAPHEYYPYHQGIDSQNKALLTNRSRSHNNIDDIASNPYHHNNQSLPRIKKKSRRHASQSPSAREHIRESTSSLRSSVRARTGEYYSDIMETRNSIDDLMTYKANPQISVDDVKHAVFAKVKTPDMTSEEADYSDDSSSDDGSSCNDIEIGSNEIIFPAKASKSARAAPRGREPGNVHIFQPMSRREVFIDDSPKKQSMKSQSNQHTGGSKVGRKSPVMRLGEKESIVATSFLVEGSKVFCLTKTTQTSPQLFAKNNEEKPKSPESNLLESSSSIKVNASSNTASSNKRDSGTWYGLTGSHTSSKSSFTSSDERPQTQSNYTSPTVTSLTVQPTVSEPSNTINSNVTPVSPKEVIPSPRRSLLKTESTSSPSRNPTPKPRTSKLSPVPIISPSEDEVFKEYTGVYLPKTQEAMKDSASESDSSDSSDGEPFMRDDDQGITRKLVRIDSRDSLTMKRRKIYRRSSSLSDKAGLRNQSPDKISVSESYRSDLSSKYSREPLRSSTENLSEPFMDALLHKAKSEEVLKHEISRSSEALLSNLEPPRRKETLQERAARILGLNSGDLYHAKKSEASNRSMLFGDSDTDSKQSSDEDSDEESVESDASALQSVATDRPTQVPVNPPDNKGQNSESFAISVTESLLNKVQDQIEIKNVEYDASSNSSSDISSILEDSDATPENSALTPVPDAEYLIEVSDSVLEETTVPCSVKPHTESKHSNTAKEYKLPDDILSQTLISNTPTPAQVSIAASYADSIYERVPAATEGSTVSELSDDATETDSLDHSARFQRLLSDSKFEYNSDRKESMANELESLTSQENSRSSTPLRQNEPRLISSPVPVASYSAPLTPDEIDIVMQLYNNSKDENDPTAENQHKSENEFRTFKPRIDPRKEKIARAIGFNVDNIGKGSPPSSSQETTSNIKLENVEDFEIFPKSPNEQIHDESSSESEDSKQSDNGNGVEEVLHSLGINPEKSWMVEL